jgi:hypothetical protein
MDLLKRILTFALVAAFLLTPLDAIQIVAHVRDVGKTPGTTLLMFGAVGALIGLMSEGLKPEPHPSGLRALIFDAGIFAGGYVMTILDVQEGGRKGVYVYLIAAVVVGVVRIVLAKGRWLDLSFVLLLGIAGPFGEAMDSMAGQFQYATRDIHDLVPYWLPLLWASGAPLVRSLAGQHRDLERRQHEARAAGLSTT